MWVDIFLGLWLLVLTLFVASVIRHIVIREAIVQANALRAQERWKQASESGGMDLLRERLEARKAEAKKP